MNLYLFAESELFGISGRSLALQPELSDNSKSLWAEAWNFLENPNYDHANCLP